MLRADRRRSFADESILGALARSYCECGTTYHRIRQEVTLEYNQSKKKGSSPRNLERLLSALIAGGLVRREHNTLRRAVYWITTAGYLHYHSKLLGHDVSTLAAVPEDLMPILIIKGIWRLTQDQERYFRDYLNANGSLLTLLPTGAGKTVIAMAEAYREWSLGTNNRRKVLYLSPFKALNGQTMNEFKQVLGTLGMRIERQDGDHHTPQVDLIKADIVISTFESVQSAVQLQQRWVVQAGVVIVDELTALDSTKDRRELARYGGQGLFSRGANLDLLLTTLLLQFRKLERPVRFVCLGIPNASHYCLQKWLGNSTRILEPSRVFEPYAEKIAVFAQKGTSGEWSLVTKDGLVREGPWKTNAERSYDRIVTVVLHYLRLLEGEHRPHRPILVFVHGRKSASELAWRLAESLTKEPDLSESLRKGRQDNRFRVLSSSVVPTVTVKQLASTVNCGIGFHHAGLFPAQRRLVEEMMNDGSLSVLFSSPTLTHGVDFPIGAVVVDGQLLEFFRYSRLEYLQLRGRVDHKDPFHDSKKISDVVVVMSGIDDGGDLDKISKLLLGTEPRLNSGSLELPMRDVFLLRVLQSLCGRPGGTTAEELVDFAKSSYDYHYMLDNGRNPNAVARRLRKSAKDATMECASHGLIRLEGARLATHGLGSTANKTGLSFQDSILVANRLRERGLADNPDLPSRLLLLATHLSDSVKEVQEVLPRRFMYEDVPVKFRKGSTNENAQAPTLRRNTVVGILSRWMDEEPLEQIISDDRHFQIYEAGLLVSARAVARNLRTIAKVAEMEELDGFENISRVSRILSVGARFGVKYDVAATELASLVSDVDIDDLVNLLGYPELIVRILLRIMVNKAITTVRDLAQYHKRRPVTLRDLRRFNQGGDTAAHLAAHHGTKVQELVRRMVRHALIVCADRAQETSTEMHNQPQKRIATFHQIS